MHIKTILFAHKPYVTVDGHSMTGLCLMMGHSTLMSQSDQYMVYLYAKIISSSYGLLPL